MFKNVLPEKYRLEPKEIPLVAKKGKRIDKDLFFVRVFFDEKIDEPKFGISVSLKVNKKAVVRNLIKRKIRSAIISLCKETTVNKAKYLIVVKDTKFQFSNSNEILEMLRPILTQRN